jgi:hypothetical protein
LEGLLLLLAELEGLVRKVWRYLFGFSYD